MSFEMTSAAEILAFWAIAGYLLGAIPFGIVTARALGLGDLRQIGSGNIGATNVLRTGSKLGAALTLIGDAGKAGAAVLLARALAAEDAAQIAGFANGRHVDVNFLARLGKARQLGRDHHGGHVFNVQLARTGGCFKVRQRAFHANAQTV